MTRAKERLILTHASERRLYGYPQANLISRFVEEIPAELVEREGMPVVAAGAGKRYVQWEDATAPEPVAPSPWTGSRRLEKASAPAKMAKASSTTPYYNGAVVKHAKFGIGTVQRSEGAGDDLKISVSFPGHGVKTLSVKYANLEVI